MIMPTFLHSKSPHALFCWESSKMRDEFYWQVIQKVEICTRDSQKQALLSVMYKRWRIFGEKKIFTMGFNFGANVSLRLVYEARSQKQGSQFTSRNDSSSESAVQFSSVQFRWGEMRWNERCEHAISSDVKFPEILLACNFYGNFHWKFLGISVKYQWFGKYGQTVNY